MPTNEIPNQCPKCGTVVRLRDSLEPSLANSKEWRCARGCTVRDVR